MNTPYTPLTPEHLAALTQLAGETHISTAPADLDQHAHDESNHAPHAAEVVIWAESAQQVADVLRYANTHRIPVTPWGVGTSLEGNPIPVCGGILLTFERMTGIVQVHADDFQVTVQPGIGYKDLNEKLARHGLFFPPDPGANASIGGMLANNAAGIRTVKYGASKDNVLRMQVALADGRLIRVGSRSVKQSSGYNLLNLFIGSEGTLGLITEATLKLVPVPVHLSALVAAFETVTDAIEAIVAVRGSGLDPAALEFIDAAHARMLAGAEGVDLTEHPTVFMEFHAANEAALEEGLAMAKEICEELGVVRIRTTTHTAERLKIWHARHNSLEILKHAHPGKQFFIMDIAVPISAYPELIAYVEELKQARQTEAYMIGHAGDGNIHVDFPYAGQAEYDAAMECNRLIVLKALALGGTATGEHGVGIGKAQYMEQEHGESLAVMQTIKQALDPNGILNPGKIFPG